MKKVKCIVPVSGGKDSQACLKMAVEKYGSSDVLGIFCDTKFEHPLTYAHVKRIHEWYGAEIVTVCGGSVIEKSLKYGRFPGGGARHCTDELKIRETKIFLAEYAKEHGAVEVWYGMRTGESSERAARYEYKDPDDLYPPHEVLAKYPKFLATFGVMFRLPIIDWTDAEVFRFLDGKHNPLYNNGFSRVGCFPCLASGDKWKMKAFNFDEFGKSQRIAVRQVEDEIGKSIWTARIGFQSDNPNQGCLLCEI